ncbi:MAG: hypothetical protein JW896_05090 [Deltaproteobacteria bacterium]|nr:hypothetical protein [Deltaproteobacteria bacterium]
MKTHEKRFVLAAILIAVLIPACAHIQEKDPSEGLKGRVSAYWETRISNEFDKAYAFFDRDYRSDITMAEFIKGANVQIKAYQITGVSLSEDQTRADVSVVYDAEVLGRSIYGIETEDEWIYEDNDWYYSPKTRGFKDLFPGKKKGL